MVRVGAIVGHFTTDIGADLLLCARLADHIAGQVQITADGDLSNGMNCGDIILDEEIEVIEDVAQAIGTAILGVGFVRCFRHCAACGVCGNGVHAAEHHCKCCEDCE